MKTRTDPRGSSTQRGYDVHWRRLRKAKITHSPLCEHCKARGLVTPAQDVDHIEPIEKRPDLRMEWSNLQSLCRPCHAYKTHGTKPTIGVDGYPVDLQREKGGAG